ncbi:glycosyltransferase family 4 protein [Adhaeribacter terreus]|uniref:Glycosyltransferase family 4 protein n=1 Tax=Adhaeribacter terreus TaxID=529703 RepID=A0ABW0ED91_9BACT
MEKILFITKVCFLDAALEYINQVKQNYILDVLIEIDPHSKNQNILNLEDLPHTGTFFLPNQLMNNFDYAAFIPYMQGCNSFQFFVHQNPKSLHWSSFKKSFQLFTFIKKLQPDFIHFDDVSIRLIPLTFLLKKKNKLIINVHDPVQHSGERNKKFLLARALFYKKAVKFITFSEFSQKLFFNIYGNKVPCIQVKLKPYKIYTYYLKDKNYKKQYITFIGRLSNYKGIDLFIESIKSLSQKYPSQKFIIAGQATNSFNLDSFSELAKNPNIKFFLTHLSTEAVAKIISESLTIVCPYKDATQSGVVMTSLALETPIIASNVGGLPEYIENGKTGILTDFKVDSLTKACEKMITNTHLEKIMVSEIRKSNNSNHKIDKNSLAAIYC